MNLSTISVRTLHLTTLCIGFFFAHLLLAQRQYWGYSRPHLDQPSNGIFRVDSNAMDLHFVHFFGPNGGGPYPSSSLMLASNGLIYGVVDSLSRDIIFSYDPVVDTFQVRAVLGTADFPNFSVQISLTEGEPGVLYLITQSSPASVFKLFLNDHSLELAATLPNPSGGTTALRSPLVKASNGKLYAARAQGATGIAAASRVVSFNPASNAWDWTLYQYSADDGRQLNGQFIEHDSRLYSTSHLDNFSTTVDELGNVIPDPKGVIYSCSMGALDHVRHAYFNDSIRNPDAGMIKHPNGLWYGMARTSVEPGVGYGLNVLYSYDVLTNTIAFVNKFIPPVPPGTDGVMQGFMLGSNGKFYGSLSAGLFEYDLALDTFQLRAPFLATGLGRGPSSSMIEICRKPNYKPRPTTSFSVCAGAHFFYDLKNVNATSVVWCRNGVVVPSQTDQRLEFDAIAEGDEGVWTCTLTNECGVTEPPAITITVNAGSFTSSAISGDTLLCGTGDTATLIGNNGGTWNTGATTATVAVLQPGLYYVTNSQACGLSISDPVQVVHLDSVSAPFFLQGLSVLQICPGDSAHLGGNLGDAWNVAPMGTWNTGDSLPDIWVQEEGTYYVTRTNACNSDTSDERLEVDFYQPPPFPEIGYLNGQGEVQNYPPCSMDSVTLVTTSTLPVNYFVRDEFNFALGNIFQGNPLTVYGPQQLGVINIGQCGYLSDTLFVDLTNTGQPPQEAPVIIPDLTVLEGCATDSTYISTTSPFAFWFWTDAFGEQQIDSTDQLLVDWNIGGNGLYTLYTYNGCGDSPPDFIQVIGTPAPTVLYAEAIDTLCFSDALQTLSPGTPPGGTYSGPGVTGNTFNPAAAGIGEHTLTYSYSDGTCTGFAQDVIAVDICQAVRGEDVSEGLWISPNPTTGSFALTLGPTTGLALVTLYDAAGAVVRRTAVQGPGPHTLSADGLATGTYEVVVEWKDSLARGRLLLTP